MTGHRCRIYRTVHGWTLSCPDCYFAAVGPATPSGWEFVRDAAIRHHFLHRLAGPPGLPSPPRRRWWQRLTGDTR